MTDFLKMKKIIGVKCWACGEVEEDWRLKRWIRLDDLPCSKSYCDGWRCLMFGNPFDVCLRELKIKIKHDLLNLNIITDV